MYVQAREWKQVVEVGELALVSLDSQFDAFELLQLLYLLIESHYQMDNRNRGFELTTQ